MEENKTVEDSSSATFILSMPTVNVLLEDGSLTQIDPENFELRSGRVSPSEHDGPINRSRSPTSSDAAPTTSRSSRDERDVNPRIYDRSGDNNIPEIAKSEIDEVDVRGNIYQAKKTVAQGLLDIALLTANASQLKNLMETENHPFYTLSLTLLSISIVLQILVGIVLIILGRMDVDEILRQRKKDNKMAVLFNDAAISGVFLITVINVFIASFISHGKAYIPVTDAGDAWKEKMYQQHRSIWDNISPRMHNSSKA